MLNSILRGLSGKVATSIIVACATLVGTLLATSFPEVYTAICERG